MSRASQRSGVCFMARQRVDVRAARPSANQPPAVAR